jgi:hypothetical protein
MNQLQRFAQRAEHDGVRDDVVAGAQRVDADLLQRTLAQQALAAVTQLGLAHHFLHDPREVQRRATGYMLLEAMMPLDNLDALLGDSYRAASG